jgi:hypothetical protein
MLFQEIGFDIVYSENVIGWFFKAAAVLIAVLIVYVIMRAASHRRKSRSPTD